MTDRNQHDAGKNMGQGLAGVNDNQRRDLMDRGRELYDKGRTLADEAADMFERGKKLVEG